MAVRPTRERIEELERQRNSAKADLEAANREIGRLNRNLADAERRCRNAKRNGR